MKTVTRNWRRWVFVLVVVGYVQNVVLLAVAMLYYPGGTFSNHDVVGYSFWSNFFSDLGRSVAFSGDSNTISRSLFEISQCILAIILCLFFAALPHLFAKAKFARRLAIIGSIFGIIAAVSLVIAIFTPWDLHPLIHEIFGGFIYGVAFFVAAALYSAAIFRNELYPNAYAYVLLTYIIITVAYVVIVIATPSLEIAWENTLQATAQKIQGYVETICISVLAYGALRVHKRLRNLGPESMLGKG